MKKMKSLQNVSSLLYLLVILGLTSCVEEQYLKLYNVDIRLMFPEDVGDLAKDGHQVILKHATKGVTIKAFSDEEGNARFEDVEPGMYTFSASISTNNPKRSQVLNGLLNAEIVSDYSDILSLNFADLGGFVISQFYYSGCLTPAGKLDYGDQFIEIYNNTSDILYADGVSIVEHESAGTNPNYWKEWEPTHIVVKSIWTIPGKGADVPVFPGKSLVIASNGYDYKSDVNGNPNSPVDLGGSDFEYHLYTDGGRDIDYPDVPNLVEDFVALRGTVTYFDVRGGSAMALVWLPEDREAFINENLEPYERLNATRYYCKIPNEFVEDAVEAVLSDRGINKRFHTSLDAGSIAVETGSKSALCIRRKIGKVVDGRNVLKDTNNSTEDFDHDVVPVPRIFDLK